MTIGAILFIAVLLITMLLQVPIGFAICITSAICFIYYGVPIATLTQNLYAGLNSYTWVAIPMFILAGNLMSNGGLSRRLVDLSESLLGGIRGGLGMTTIFASAFFSAISGSSPATVAAIGSIMIPEMKEKGYPEKFAAAIAASGGALGVLIPPSVTLIVYGVLAQVSISSLFFAIIIPGLMVALAMALTSYILARRYLIFHDDSKSIAISLIWKSLKRALLPLLAPVIILGGIYSGIFTPTESAVIAVFYGFIIGRFYKELTWKSFWKCMELTIATTGALAIIWAGAQSYSFVLTISGIAQTMVYSLSHLDIASELVVILMMFVAILLGCFINSVGVIVLLTPILVPSLNAIGFDLLVFGIIFIVTAEIGGMTPPVGVNLFVARTLVDNTDILHIAKIAIPYTVVLFIIMLILLFVPGIVTYIPSLL